MLRAKKSTFREHTIPTNRDLKQWSHIGTKSNKERKSEKSRKDERERETDRVRTPAK